MGFRCNVIRIDLPLVKEADRQVSKINQPVHTGGAAGSHAAENQEETRRCVLHNLEHAGSFVMKYQFTWRIVALCCHLYLLRYKVLLVFSGRLEGKSDYHTPFRIIQLYTWMNVWRGSLSLTQPVFTLSLSVKLNFWTNSARDSGICNSVIYWPSLAPGWMPSLIHLSQSAAGPSSK